MEIYYKDLRPYYNVIDIRSKEEYERGHYINAINIPSSYLICFTSKYLNKEDTYYLYCASGIRSKKACDLISIMGYKVVNVKDGYKDKLL